VNALVTLKWRGKRMMSTTETRVGRRSESTGGAYKKYPVQKVVKIWSWQDPDFGKQRSENRFGPHPPLVTCLLCTCVIVTSALGYHNVEQIRVRPYPPVLVKADRQKIARSVAAALEQQHGIRIFHCPADIVMEDIDES
jgi:hypothetical protein